MQSIAWKKSLLIWIIAFEINVTENIMITISISIYSNNAKCCWLKWPRLYVRIGNRIVFFISVRKVNRLPIAPDASEFAGDTRLLEARSRVAIISNSRSHSRGRSVRILHDKLRGLPGHKPRNFREERFFIQSLCAVERCDRGFRDSGRWGEDVKSSNTN